MKKIVLLCIVLMAVNGFAGDLSHTTANLKTLLDTIDPNADGSPADGTLALTTGDTMTGNLVLDDGTTDSPSIVLTDENDESVTIVKVDEGYATLTSGEADSGLNILVGNLLVGDGSPGQTINGEDAYVNGLLEVDGVIYADGGVTGNVTGDVSGNAGTATAAAAQAITDNAIATVDDAAAANHDWATFTANGIKGTAVTASKVVCTDADGEPVACTNLTDVAITDDQNAGEVSCTDEFDNSDATNVQDVLDDLDAAIAGGGTTLKDLVTTSPLSGGENDILPGADGDVTLSIADAAADGSTKGAASFAANDFDASSGNISLDYTNAQKATNAQSGLATAAQITALEAVDTEDEVEAMIFDGDAGTFGGNITFDDGSTDSPSLIFTDETDETATFTKTDDGFLGLTTVAADGLNILVGNLKIGDGSPSTAQDGEDLYVNGAVEIDGNTVVDGTLSAGAAGFSVDADGDTTVKSLITTAVDDGEFYFDPATASESEWWIGPNHDSVGDDNDPFEIRQSTTPGTSVMLSVAASTGNVTVAGDLTVTGDDIVATTNTSGAAWIGDGTNYNPVVISGDLAIGTDGAATIQANAVENSMMADNAVGNAEMADDAITMTEIDDDGDFTSLTGDWATTGYVSGQANVQTDASGGITLTVNAVNYGTDTGDADIPDGACDAAGDVGNWVVLITSAADAYSLTSNDASNQFTITDLASAETAGDEIDVDGTMISVMCIAAELWKVTGYMGAIPTAGGAAD